MDSQKLPKDGQSILAIVIKNAIVNIELGDYIPISFEPAYSIRQTS